MNHSFLKKSLLKKQPVPLPVDSTEPMQKGRVFLLSAAHFVNDSYQGFIAPLLPLLMIKLDFNLALAGVLTAIQTVFSSLSQPLFGHISDKIRQPYLVILGPILTAIFIGMIGLLPSFESIIVILILAGIGTAAFHPQSSVYTACASGRQSGLGMSLFVTGGSAGHALGALIILPIVTTFGMKYSVITIAFGIIISFLLFRNLPVLPPISFHKKVQIIDVKAKKPGISLFILWIIVSIRAFIVVGFITFMPIYLHNKNVILLLAGSAITIFELSGAVGTLLGGPLSDRFGKKIIIILSTSLSLPFLWLFLHTVGLISFIFLGCAGFFLFSSIPVSIIMAQELFPKRISTVSSLMMGMAWGIGGLLVPPLGAVADQLGIGQALELLIYLGLLGAIASAFLPGSHKVKKLESNLTPNFENL